MNKLTPSELFLFERVICPLICIYQIYELIYEIRKYEMWYYHNKYIKPDMQVKIASAIQRKYLKSYIKFLICFVIWNPVGISKRITAKLTKNDIFIVETIMCISIFIRQFYDMRKYEISYYNNNPYYYYLLSYI